MSLPKKMTVKCSKCGAEIDVTVFESVNTDYSADITEQIISGDLFNAKCDKCGFVLHLEYDILYHDVKHGAMIWVLHDNSPEYANKVAELRSSANILGYKTTRIVNNMNELRQKVACLENGRDDRIIELCKVFIAYNLLSKQPDFEFNNAFYTNFLNQERVFLYDKNGQELSCDLTDDIYSMLSEMYYNSEYASDFQDYYALVDYDWAESVIQPLLEKEAERIDAKNAAGSAPTSSSSIAEKKVVCPKCKQSLPEDSVFCHYCGTSIAAPASANNPANTSINKTPLKHSASSKKSMKKPIIITIVIVLAVALIAGIVALCLGSDDNTSTDFSKNDSSIITVALEDDFAPFSWSESGKYYGLHVDIAKEIAKRNGVGVKFVIADFEDLIEGVDSGKFDLAFGIEKTDSRASLVSFTDSYYEEMCCIYYTKEEKSTFSEWTFYNKVLSDMIDDGTINSLLSKYNLVFDYEKLGLTRNLFEIATIIADDAETYCEYMAELDETLSKGSYGIDLQKEKATEYVNNLSLDYGQRIILFKIQFPSDTTYCSDIVDYLNEREDISYDDEVFILEELGFAVFEDGTVKW